jgi:outer membrane protein assembly factor BamB
LARVWKVRPTDNAGGRFNGVAALGGDLYAVGENGSSGSRDFLVERYTTAGARIWTATSGGSGDDVLTGVVAVGGRLFAAGHTTSSGAGGADAVVMEIDPSTGAVIWTTHLGGAQDDRAHALVTDGSSLFAVGESRSYATLEGNTVGQNDLALWHLTLVVDVEIDIKPGSYPNSINLGAQGGIPVAIFSSPTFDATTIDPATVELAEAQIRIVGKGKLMVATEDVDGDGLMDLVVQMETSAFEATDGDTEAVLTGQTFDGICIRGVDTIRIVPPGDGGV